MSLTARLQGIWGFPLSSFAGNDLDGDLLAAGVSWQVDGGVDVICTSGLIAQGGALTAEERIRSARIARSVSIGHCLVVATLPHPETAVIEAAALAPDVDGFLVVPQSGELQALSGTIRSVANCAPSVPIFVYHRPPLLMTTEDIVTLRNDAPLAGVKDGHRDVRSFRRLRQTDEMHNLLWLTASEDVALAFWALGVDDFCPFSTAYAPRYSRAWLAALTEGDVETARELLSAHAYPMVDLRVSRPQIDISVVKEAMRVRGVPVGDSRPPVAALRDDERAAVARLLSQMDMALEAAPSAAAVSRAP